MSAVLPKRIVTAEEVQARLRKWADGELLDAELKAWARETFARDDFRGETVGVDHVVEVLAGSRAHKLDPTDYPTLAVALKSGDPERFMKRMVWGEPVDPPEEYPEATYQPYHDAPPTPARETRASFWLTVVVALALLALAMWGILRDEGYL